MSFFNTPEFYIILTIVASAVVALASKPEASGPVLEYLLAGDLADDEDGLGAAETVELECLDDGKVMLTRSGIDSICQSGAASLAVKVKGHDVQIEERLTAGRGLLAPAQKAVFTIKFLPPGRYHVRYNSDKTGLFAAFPFTVKPGIRARHPLSR